MKRDLVLAGILGLLLGAGIDGGAVVLSARLPILLQDSFAVAIVFGILLAFALLEIPAMVFGLRQLARSASTSPKLLLLAFAFYVAFASVYAAIFILLTGQTMLGQAIAALCGARLASGLWIK